MNMRRALLTAMMGLVLLAATGCFGRSDEDYEGTGSLLGGTLNLQEFPVTASGVAGLGQFCRLVHACACTFLDPTDIEGCREEVWDLDELTCEEILRYSVPECLPD